MRKASQSGRTKSILLHKDKCAAINPMHMPTHTSIGQCLFKMTRPYDMAIAHIVTIGLKLKIITMNHDTPL